MEEEDNVKLQCSAAGIPRPLVTWKRADGAPIVNGTWKSEFLQELSKAELEWNEI